MKVISTVYEASTAEHIYRFHEDADGVKVKRVPVAHPFWSHSILCQWYTPDAGWKPALQVKDTRHFDTLDDAANFLGLST
jgi:hypothetical protein